MGRALSLIFLAALICSCSQKEAPTTVEARFEPLGLRVFGGPFREPLELYDSEGNLVLAYPPLAAREVLMIFPWQPERDYRLRLGKTSLALKAPAKRPLLKVTVFSPLGQRPQEYFLPGELPERFLLAGPDRDFEVAILLESLSLRPVVAHIDGEEIRLEGEFSRSFVRRRIHFAPEVGKIHLSFEIRSPFFYQRSLIFSYRPLSLKGAVEVVSWDVPTDAYGFIEGHRERNTLVAPVPLWERLGYSLGIKAKGFSRFEPFAFQTLILKNHLDLPLTLLIQADFLDPKTRRPVAGFYPKQFGPTGGTKKIIAFVDLPPRGMSRAILPIYLDKTVPPGEYLRRVTVTTLGQETPLLSLEAPLGVVRGSSFFTAALMVVIVVGVGYSLSLLFLLRRYLARFNLRSLVLISLMGAVGFGLDFLGGLISNVLYGLLGPFNILVGGLITETTHYLVLSAIIYLLPFPGTVTLAGLITYLMGGVLMGGFGVTDAVFVGSRLAYQEGFLLTFGVTRGSQPRRLPLALSLSLADAFSTASSLVLHATFYRLFFPLWYVALAVVVKGFLYTFLGVLWGIPFGRVLRRVER